MSRHTCFSIGIERARNKQGKPLANFGVFVRAAHSRHLTGASRLKQFPQLFERPAQPRFYRRKWRREHGRNFLQFHFFLKTKREHFAVVQRQILESFRQ